MSNHEATTQEHNMSNMTQVPAEQLKVGDKMFRKYETWDGDTVFEPCEVVRVSHDDSHVFATLWLLGYPDGTRNLRSTAAWAFGHQVFTPQG
jgi:hypothetical protein